MTDGSAQMLDFTRAEIEAGVVAKPLEIESWDSVRECMASWNFQAEPRDIVPQGTSIDNHDIACNYNAPQNTVEIIPYTAVIPLAISVPATSFTSRGAEALVYRLQVTQIHGPPWTFAPSEWELTFAGDDLVMEHVAFTRGCLSYELFASWQTADDSVIEDEPRSFIGETYELVPDVAHFISFARPAF
jgi:hypothetical protein